MSKKEELIKAIKQQYADLAKIDEDSDKVYNQAKEQWELHAADPIVYSPTAMNARMARGLAQRYAERYEAIAVLFDQLDEVQGKAHFAWKNK